MSKSIRAVVVSIVLPFVAPGCGSSSDDSPPAQPSGVVEIGPEGGELVDNGSGGFPGFALKIPPGALAQKTKVLFAGAFDPTELPPDARQVGVQVKLLPEGTVLAKPAQLTVPVDHDLRSHYENPAAECKVWARDGDSWKRLEAVATTEESVTVEISTFHSAAAAGVIAKAAPLTCTGCKAIPSLVVGAAACADPSGYCFTEVPRPQFPDSIVSFGEQAWTVADGKLFFLKLASGTITPLSYDLFGAHELVRYPALTPSTTINGAVTLAEMAVPANGDVWLSIGGVGNVRFPKTGLNQIFDVAGPEGTGIKRPESVVVTKSGDTDVITRFNSNFSFATSIRTFSATKDARTSQLFLGSFSETFAAVGRGAPAYVGRSSKNGICFATFVAADAPLDCNPNPGFLPLPSFGEFAVAGNGSLVAAVPASAGGAAKAKLLLANGTFQEFPITFPIGVSDLVIGDDGRVYAINSTRPQIMIYDKATPGAITVLPLTTLPSSDEAYDDFLPIRIFNLPGKNELALITQGPPGGKNVYRIRRAP